jgi:uncharacterized protein (DUF362 family)
MPASISRRDFLRGSLGFAGAVSLGRIVDLTEVSPPVETDILPQVVVSQGLDKHTPADILKTALDGLGGIGRFVKPGQVVAIKPNATWAFAPHTASSTDPDVLRALIELVKEAGASRIIVMDHCSLEPGAMKALKINKIGQVVEEMGVEGLFPDRYLAPKETYTTVELPDGHSYKKIGVIKAAVDADVRINMAVAKSHSVTRVTLALKHMMGFLESPSGLHAYLHKGIADINTKTSPIKADLHILEALRIRTAYNEYVTCAGPETDETHPFMIFRKNQIIAGLDPVLMDAYACSTFYKIKPKELAHLNNAFEWGVGDIDIESAKTVGSFRIFNVGEIPEVKPTSQPTSTPTVQTKEMASAITPDQKVEKPAPIPLPEVGTDAILPEPSASVQEVCTNAANPNDMLNKALIPVSIILAGAGLIAARKKSTGDDETEDNVPHEK